jgi:hypothetical protein
MRKKHLFAVLQPAIGALVHNVKVTIRHEQHKLAHNEVKSVAGVNFQ